MPKFVVASTPNVESKMLILPHLAVHNVHVPLEFVNFFVDVCYAMVALFYDSEGSNGI